MLIAVALAFVVVYVPEAALGYQYVFDPALEFVPAVGVRAAAAWVGDDVANACGTHVPIGAMLYVMLRGAPLPATR